MICFLREVSTLEWLKENKNIKTFGKHKFEKKIIQISHSNLALEVWEKVIARTFFKLFLNGQGKKFIGNENVHSNGNDHSLSQFLAMLENNYLI